MARRRSAAEEEDVDVNLTPMLDVTFILLIFFIVTAVFVKEPGQKVDRPIARNSEDTQPAILVAITSTDEVWVAKKLVKIPALKAEIEQLREENPRGDAIVQVDKDSKNGVLVDVMFAIQAAGVEKIHVATVSP
jgi:Biopolymer transport protein